MSESQEVGMKRAAPDGSEAHEHPAKAPKLDETNLDGVDGRPASLEALLPPVANDVNKDAAFAATEAPADVSSSVPVVLAVPTFQEQGQPEPAHSADQAGLLQAQQPPEQPQQQQEQQLPPIDQDAPCAAAAAVELKVEADAQAAGPTHTTVLQQPPQQEQQQGDRRPQVVSADANRFKMPADAILKQEIPLVRRMASCVIGIKGTTVSKLRRESGAKIHVRPGQAPAELDQVVEIEGSIESVLTCIRLIDELLRVEDAQYKMVPKPEVTCRFSVLPEMIGPAIIGKSGTHAKHIRERTGVRIEVVPPTDGNVSRQQIVLHGAADRTREAYHLLLGNIRKYGPNLPADAVPAPLPFPHRPPPPAAAAATPPSAGYGRGTRYGDGRSSGGRGAPYGGRGAAAAPPPPPPRAAPARSSYRYDDYGAAVDPYARTHDPYAPHAPAPAAPAPAYASSAPAAYPAAAAATVADPGAAVAGQPQVMYILQDGVLKPLTVMYQQAGAVAAAAPAAAAPAAQVVASYGAATGPSSTGTGAVVYQQPSAGASYAAYSAPADAAAGGAAAIGAAPAAGTWMGAVQQLASSVTAAPAGSASGTYATAAAPVATYQQQQVAQPTAQQYTTAGGVQYVQYAYPQQ